jgi:hypothetical protein
MIEALRRAWDKVRRVPQRSPSATVAPRKPLYTATVNLDVAEVRWSSPADVTSWAPSPDAGSAPIPPQPSRSSWATYAKLIADHPSYDGWTFCKFGVRGPDKEDHSEVMGIVRAPFGAWWAPFLCVPEGLGQRAVRALACIEHTRSGMAVGIFGDMDVAVEAAEIAMRMDSWASFDVEQAASLLLVYRVRSAWEAAGIVLSSYHAFPTVNGKLSEGQSAVPIFIKSPMANAHRPEKLS